MTAQVQEIIMGGWFALSTVLTVMMIYVGIGAWRSQGYLALETQAAVSLATYALGSSLSGCWWWLYTWLPNHGFPETAALVSSMLWWPLAASVVGVTGALCSIRVFFPWADRHEGRAGMTKDMEWLIPLAFTLIFLLIASSFGH